MTRGVSIAMVLGLLWVAAVNVYLAFFFTGFEPFSLLAAIVCAGCAWLIWRMRP